MHTARSLLPARSLYVQLQHVLAHGRADRDRRLHAFRKWPWMAYIVASHGPQERRCVEIGVV